MVQWFSHNTQNKSRAELAVYARFLAHCRPKLVKLEAMRLEKLRILRRQEKIAYLAVAAFICIFAFILLSIMAKGYFSLEKSVLGIVLGFVTMILIGGGTYSWLDESKKEYAKAYKTEILPDIARLFGNFGYSMTAKIPMEILEPSHIIPVYNSHLREGYTAEDYFEGEYKGVGIHFSEIKLDCVKDQTFKGLAILLTHGTRKFHGHTIVTDNHGGFFEWLMTKTSHFKRANLIDSDFEKKFDVFTTDQVEARYLIDPKIMESLKTLYHKINGDDIKVAFYDSKILILIGDYKNPLDTSNRFEAQSINIPATDESWLMHLEQEIAQIFSIIDTLALYEPGQRRRT